MTDRKLMQHMLEVLNRNDYPGWQLNIPIVIALRERLAEQPAQPEQCECPACKVTPHASDCAVHNEPAYPKGACNCGAQPEQEPVATLDDLEQEIYENTRQFVSRDVMEWMLKRYYTTPPQRKPLTDEEILECWKQAYEPGRREHDNAARMARAIEAKLKEKNT